MKRIDMVLTIVGALMVIGGARSVWAATQQCNGKGTVTNPKNFDCGPATCNPGPRKCFEYNNGLSIPAGNGTFPSTDPNWPGRNYAFCMCPGETETDCCHLVGVLSADGSTIIAYATVGQCISCPTTGVCDKVQSGGMWIAYCH